MMIKTKHILILSLLFLLCRSVYGERMLVDFISELGIDLMWHPLRDMVTLEKNDTNITFRPGNSWILVNYNTKVSVDPMERKDGAVVLPDETENILRSYFTVTSTQMDTPRIAAILIDPGHGGRDPGAVASYKWGDTEEKVVEKEIVLTVSLDVYRLLKARYPDKKILLTRSGDTYPSLEERVELAHTIDLGSQEAIIFVSIHANASLNREASGFEVWYLPPEYRRTVLDPETIEGKTEDILPILNTMLEEEYTVESILLAKSILSGLDDQIGPVSLNRGLKDEIWFVVRKAKMPSVLVELGFITNKEEALRLKNVDYLKKLSFGIYNGIDAFVTQFERTKGFTVME